MNERINGLWWKASIGYNNQSCDPEVIEKFAALIVKDCINISTKVDKNPYVPDHDQAKKIIREIKQHFGVE